ncbi:MAG: hypothetical protein WC365_06270 [Candidatus Babeliales bacterium]|jgi:hypothetical protein
MIESILRNIRNWLEQQKKWYTLSYHGLKIKYDFNPRTGTCSVCGRKGLTNIHHTCYNFTYTEIRHNDSLALLFVFEVCFTHHEQANSMRKLLFEDPNMELKTDNKKLQVIFDNHKRLLKARDKFNENRAKNLLKKWNYPRNEA